MNTLLRPPTIDEVLRKHVPLSGRRDIVVNPEGGFFEAKNLHSATRRSGRHDKIHLPGGTFTLSEITKSLELLSAQTGPVQLKGPLRIHTEGLVTISGINIAAEPGVPTITVEKGTLVLVDCNIQGSLSVGSPAGRAEIYLKNCLIGHAEHGIFLKNEAFAEVNSTRIADCQTGIYVSPGTSCAVHDCTINNCLSVTEADPGAAIHAENGSVYCEGVTFLRNSIGLYLSHCEEARVLSCHFDGSETAAIIASNSSTSPPLQIHSCTVSGQTTTRCAQVVISGGTALVSRTNIESAPPAALSLDQVRVELKESNLASANEPALEAQSTHFSAAKLTCFSENSTGLSANACQGILRKSRFIGKPPTAITESNQLLQESCQSAETLANIASRDPASTPVETIDDVLLRLQQTISQDVVRNELERMLRLAHAGQQRRQAGLPNPIQSYHSVFMGPPGTGKRAAAQMLADGLYAFGVIPSPKVQEISLRHGLNGAQSHEGVVFVRAHDATSSEDEETDTGLLVEQILEQSPGIVVLEGARDELRRLLRHNSILDRTFRHMVFFTRFGPLELAAFFAQLCERDRIQISVDARRTILLALHLYSERKDKRFANTHGVEILYEMTRRRYLERCSLAESVDLELEPMDFEIPQDKILLTALERSPSFVSFCPACTRENPWLPGLDPQVACLHCGASYKASWGVWKDSSTYRRVLESLARPVPGAELAPRPALPPLR